MWWPATVFLLFLQSADLQTEGRKALEKQDYAQAEQLFTKAVEADPKDYGAQFHLALAESLLGKDRDAIGHYQTVLTLKPGLYEAELNLGILLLRQKQAQASVPYLQAAQAAKPAQFRPVFYLAEAAFEAGDLKKAQESYESALKLDPKSTASELGLARALARQNLIEESEPHFRKAGGDALLELASLFESEHKPDEAVAIYRQFPDNIGARERAGELLLGGNRPAEAIPEFAYAVEKAPTAVNRLALATAYLRNKQPDLALPLITLALQGEPNNYDLHMLKGRTLRDQRSFVPAANEFFRGTQLKPDSVEAWSELGGALILIEDYPRALGALDHVRTLGGETAAHFYFRAIILDKMKQYKPALENYQKFLDMSQGKSPDEEFKARQRARIIERILSKR